MKHEARRVFVGSIATETNTFSPLRTDIGDFHEGFYAPPGTHPQTPTLCSAVFPVARARAAQYNWTLIEGTATWAEPGGVVNQHTWTFLREQLLAELSAALPVDIVLLGLHGAMVAQGCLDCEGELLHKVRELVGPHAHIAATLATALGKELYSYRGTTRPEFLGRDEAIDQATRPRGNTLPVVVADVWDNPGGGVPGDSTLLLQTCIDKGVQNIALATIWDPIAVRLCFSAGIGARLPLRFGGKVSHTGGSPVDAMVTVKNLVRNASQHFGTSIVSLGDAVCIEFNGIEVILNTSRTQVYSPDIFSNLGIDPLQRDILIVKSTNHFAAAFAPIAARILYVAVDGPYPSDPATNDYQHLRRTIWPRHQAPFGATVQSE
jgi:microcystin degradation protein MlrC